jgi:hypothetical protein
VRNVYTLINFGDFIDGSPSNVAPPFIQLLSTVDKAQMHQDFVNARVDVGQGSTGNTQPADPGSGSGSDQGDDKNGSSSHTPGMILASVVLMYIVLGSGF